jgi:hypothetical protein
MSSLSCLLFYILILSSTYFASSTYSNEVKLLQEAEYTEKLVLSHKCSSALLPAFQYDQWDKARQAVGLPTFGPDMDKAILQKIRPFYEINHGVSLYNISNTVVPYVLVWKAGNNAIRSNLLQEENRLKLTGTIVNDSMKKKLDKRINIERSK